MVFLDANILLELILPNRRSLAPILQYLEQANQTAISSLTIHLVFYFGRKVSIADTILHGVIAENTILSLERSDYEWAALYEQGQDFEDALQVACAIRSGCSEFVTLDRRLATRYADGPIKVTLLA